ncbi:hypothetical protein GCM10011412_27710 [Maribacter cobaltidurans]|jgi:glutathione peroxidase|nr:hypothetical protein GCM10011412_27710 [Maribacter cobaltidurans]
MDSNIFKFEVKKLNGESISLKEFEGKTIVIINTASKCGLTPQYKGLEYLYKKYSDKGLVILGFPSNQFGQQEKGTAE